MITLLLTVFHPKKITTTSPTKMNYAIIKLTGIDDAAIQINPEFDFLRIDAMEASALITAVKDEETSEAGQVALQSLKDLEKRVEDSRKVVKAPVLSIGKDIDGMCKGFLEEVKVESERLSALIGPYLAKAREDGDELNPHYEMKGTRLRVTYKHEVEDIDLLLKENPDLVTITPNKAKITALIKDDPEIEIPGVKIWKEERV